MGAVHGRIACGARELQRIGQRDALGLAFVLTLLNAFETHRRLHDIDDCDRMTVLVYCVLVFNCAY